MKMTHPTLARLMIATIAGVLCLTTASVAQTASTKKDDGIEKMTPFEVSGRKTPGPYLQEEVISVTKFAVPLIDVPQNIFVFTRQFMEDLNIGEVRYALAYNASLQGGVYSVGGSYRGFSNQEKLRDGFKMSTFFDYPPIHFERIELLKGPSAVIYGRTEPGGITNYVSKRPVPGANFAIFNFGIGDNNGNLRQSYSFDINTSLATPGGTPLDLRLTGATQQFEDMISGSTSEGKQPQNSIRLAATYWLTDKARLYVNYLYYSRNYYSQFGRYASFAVGVPQATAGKTIPFSIVYGRDAFEDYSTGRNFNWQYNDTTAILDYKVASNIDFRAGFSMHKRTNEDYLVNVAATTLAGAGAIRITNVNKNKNDVFTPDFQAHVVWKPGADHNVLFGYSRNWLYSDVKQWFQQRNPDGTAFGRTFNPAQGIPQALPADIIYVPTAWDKETRDFQSLIFNYHGGFLDNKLHVMAGVAHNSIDVDDRTTFFRTARTRFKTNATNPQAGIIYKLTNEWSVFALGSQSTQYNNTTTDSFGNFFGPITGEGVEVGFKFAARGGRINGTATYYNTDQADNIVFDPLARSRSYQQSVTAGTPNPALLGDNVAGGTTHADGFEVDITAAVTPDWNLTFSYAHNNQTFKKNPDPVLKGTKISGLEPNKVAIYTRYDFNRGEAQGLFLGGGLIALEKIYGGFSPGSNRTKTFWRDGQTRIDMLLGYKFKAFGRDQQIKVTGFGLNKPKAFTSGFNTDTNDVYYLKAATIWYLDYQVRF